MRSVSVAVVLSVLLAATAQVVGARDPKPLEFVYYGVPVDGRGTAHLQVFNAEDYAICIAVTEWPSDPPFGDLFVVFGTDGQRWKYTGLEGETIGRAKTIRVNPEASLAADVPVGRSYESAPSASKDIGAVYFGGHFLRCTGS
jgi:hypothetical protein